MNLGRCTLNREPVNILLVEDNFDHADLARQGLQDLCAANKVFHVADGEAALDYLHHRGEFAESRISPRPDLILLDLRLPKIDGLEVLRQIKESRTLRQIPVVVLTTSDGGPDVSLAYDRHANSYLVKPIDFSQFSRLMSDLGSYWLGWNRVPDVKPPGDSTSG
jgi:CheY-like chemotaxis protein